MSFKTTFSGLLARTFSLDGGGATHAARARRFIVQLAAWMLITRIALAAWAIVYPDSRFFSSIDTLSIAPMIDLYIDGSLATIPANDSYFYWLIAEQGAGWNSTYGWSLVNFSQVYPVLIAAAKTVFSTWSPFVLNTAFSMATPAFLVSFLGNVFKDEATTRRAAIVVLFNPIFLAYSLFGLTEPLHYLLLFAVLSARYKTGLPWRAIEYAGLVVMVLNRFIAVVLAVFYLFKAIFTRGAAIKQRVALLVPVFAMGATYIGWEWACRQLFGITPSEARSIYWHHGFNLDPRSPGFMINQAPLLLAGVLLGVLVLVTAFSKNKELIDLEATSFSRVDLQGMMAMGAVTFLFLGIQNEPISILRYTGTAFPLFIVLVTRVPSSKLLPLASFGVATGMVASHVITTFVIFSTSPPIPSFTWLDLILCTAFSSAYIAASIVFFMKRHGITSDMKFMLAHLLLATLIVPLALYFP